MREATDIVVKETEEIKAELQIQNKSLSRARKDLQLQIEEKSVLSAKYEDNEILLNQSLEDYHTCFDDAQGIFEFFFNTASPFC